jgi:hypothetical protein
MSPNSCKRPWYRLHGVNLVVLLVVAAALVVCNVGGNYRTRSLRMGESVKNQYTTYYGWPLVAYRRSSVAEDGETVWLSRLNRTRYRTPFGRFSTSAVIALDAAVVLLLAASATFTTEYWIRHRRGPFQFGLRSLFVLTALSAVFLAFLQRGEVDWGDLLLLPIGYGCACVFVVAAIVLERWFASADARLTRARKKWQASMEERSDD